MSKGKLNVINIKFFQKGIGKKDGESASKYLSTVYVKNPWWI